MDVTQDPIFQEVIKDRGLKPPTIQLYTYAFTKYCKTTGLTPTQLIEEAEDEEDNNIRLRRRKITQYFHDFQKYLEGLDHTPETVSKQISIIRTFYFHYDIKLPKKPKLQTDPNTSLLIPTLPEIKLALKNCNPCFEAIIVLMCSSAMGRSEIISLTLEDMAKAVSKYYKITLNTLHSIGEHRQEILDSIKGPLTWKIRRVKTDYPYVTFSTKESLEYILLYLESTTPPLSLGEQLFKNKWGRPLAPNVFSQYFRDLNNRCGFGMQGRSIYFRSHNLRKWFARQLENTTLGYMNTRRLMGHQVYDQTSRRYFQTNEQAMFDLYFENMGHVSIYSNLQVFNHTDEDVKELKDDLERVKRLLRMKKGS